jgi:hypothetical protein
MLLVVDIHALSDDSWRSSMIGVDSWDEYHAACVHDQPVSATIDLVNSMRRSGNTVIGISARPEKWRKLTNEWLIKYKVDLSELIMREDIDFRPSIDIKKDIVKRLHPVAFVIDDKEDVCRAVTSMGISTLQVRR